MSTPGISQFADGAIANQALLLQEIRDGLTQYNSVIDPVVGRFSETTVREVLRVSQAPKKFRRKAPGGMAYSQAATYRQLIVPFKSYDLNSEFQVEWLQDALASDVRNEFETAMIGDTNLMEALFWEAVLTARPVGSIASAYQAGFYNGETDVPPYKNNKFAGTAHFHYLGLDATTLTKAMWTAMKKDIQEHGYGLAPGTLHVFMNEADQAQLEPLVDTNAASTILQAMTVEREKAIDRGKVGTGLMIDGVIVHFTANVPVGYIAMMSDDVAPIARREHFKPEHQGLQAFTETQMDGYPLAGMKFMRRTGFSVQHMGAGVVRQLVSGTTYTSPALTVLDE